MRLGRDAKKAIDISHLYYMLDRLEFFRVREKKTPVKRQLSPKWSTIYNIIEKLEGLNFLF